MFRRSKFRLPIAWTLLFAVLFNIALPSMASADRRLDPIALGEICSTSGLKTIVASGVDRAPGEHADLLHDGHCQLCSVDLSAFLLPAVARMLPLAIEAVRKPLPRPHLAAPLPRSLRPPSHAPPVLS